MTRLFPNEFYKNYDSTRSPNPLWDVFWEALEIKRDESDYLSPDNIRNFKMDVDYLVRYFEGRTAADWHRNTARLKAQFEDLEKRHFELQALVEALYQQKDEPDPSIHTMEAPNDSN